MKTANHHLAPIGEHVLPIETWSPTNAAPDEEFGYIDIASVDREKKRITNANQLLATDAPCRARQILRDGDVLVSTVRPNLNAVAMVPAHLSDAIASTGFCVLRCHPQTLDRNYLFHWVRTAAFVSDMIRKATGASYPAVSDRIIKESEIPLPPLSEQKRIADILDKADAIRRKREEGIRLTEELLRSTFLEMFGDPAMNPKGWPQLPFPEVCDSRLGKMLDANKQTGNYCKPYMRNFNVQWGRLDLSSVFEMDFRQVERDEFRLKKGDVLICEGGAGVGQTAIWNDELPECYFQKSLHRVRPKPQKATPQYVSMLMWFMMRSRDILGAISSATIPHLTGEKLKTIKIPTPPYELQKRYEKAAYALIALSANQKEGASEAKALFDSLVQRAFRGEL
jgi:type I restriction enzyme S subunit